MKVREAFPWTMILMLAPKLLSGLTLLLAHRTPEDVGRELGEEIGNAVGGSLRGDLGGVLRAAADAVAGQ